jgi:hypothetical protein
LENPYVLPSVVDPDPLGSALILVDWIRIREKKLPTKIEKGEEISCFVVLDVLF